MKDLKTCREEIDAIDQQIIALFEQRMNVAKDVITYKLAHDMEIFQSAREQEVIEKNVNRIRNEELKEYAKTFIQDMILSILQGGLSYEDIKHIEATKRTYEQTKLKTGRYS